MHLHAWKNVLTMHSRVDLVLLVWAGLTLLFVKAAVQKDILNLITIGFGFVIQAVMMALIFFK